MELKENENKLIIKLAPYFWRFKNEAHVNDSAIKWVWEMLQQDDIKEALSLLELKRQGKLFKLAERQEIPAREYPFPNDRNLSFGYLDATQDFIKAGFKKVESL